MSGSRKQYDAEFKREMVRVADSLERGDSAVEQEMDLYKGMISTWRKH